MNSCWEKRLREKRILKFDVHLNLYDPTSFYLRASFCSALFPSNVGGISFRCRLAGGFSPCLSSDKLQTHPVCHKMGYMWRRLIDSKATKINRSLSIGLNQFWTRHYYFQDKKLVSSTVKTFRREQFFISVFRSWLVWSLNLDTCSDRRASSASTFSLQITVKLSNQSEIQSP